MKTKRRLHKMVLILLISGFWTADSKADDEITMTDYYPIPYGNYNTLSSSGNTMLATAPALSTAAVAIGTTAAPPTPALLELNSTTKGLLLPSMSTAQRDLIAGKTDGLVIFNSDAGIKSIQFWDSATSGWKSYGSSGGTSTFWSAVTGFPNDIRNTNPGNVGIGTGSSQAPAAKLTVKDGAFALYDGAAPTVTSPTWTPGLDGKNCLLWHPQRQSLYMGIFTNEVTAASIGMGAIALHPNSFNAKGNHSICLAGAGADPYGTDGVNSIAIGEGYVRSLDGIVIGSDTKSDDTSATGFSSVIGYRTYNNAFNSIAVNFTDNSTNTVSNCINLMNRVYIKSGTGNVGIFTSTPGAKLDVVGNIYATAFSPAAPSCSPSDAMFKRNILPLESPLGKIKQMRGVHFRWNEEAAAMGFKSDAERIGVTAQEVEREYPTLVIESDYKAVDYARLSAPLLGAILELQKKNNALERRLMALEQKKSLERSQKRIYEKWVSP